jgi:hypothetical protein
MARTTERARRACGSTRRPKHEPAIVPGNLEKSELWKRITAADPDDVMPPPKSHKVLKSEQKELFKQWILAGAPWQGHWAYIKPERPVPPDAAALKVQHPESDRCIHSL